MDYIPNYIEKSPDFRLGSEAKNAEFASFLSNGMNWLCLHCFKEIGNVKILIGKISI